MCSHEGPEVERAFAVRRVEEHDWKHLKSVRLAALAQSPEAFGSSLAREQGTTDDGWREWIREWPTFVAFHQNTAVGLAAGVNGDQSGERKLIAAWVHPDHRRSGVASALIESLKEWARADGAARLTLWVARTNDSAVRLYRRHHFMPTGRSKPLPSNPALIEDELALDLH